MNTNDLPQAPSWQTSTEAPLEVATFHAYDQETAELYTQAPNTYSILWDLKQKLRGYTKYGHPFKTTEDALESLYSELCDVWPE